MWEAFGLLFGCSLLGVIYVRSGPQAEDGKIKSRTIAQRFVFLLIAVWMICFSGLRTIMNDTSTYLSAFSVKIPDTIRAIRTIDWKLGSNPLFVIYQIILRSFISSSGHVFLFLTSVFVTTSFLLFIRKYSVDFAYSLFVFIGFTSFAFTLAAIKQTMATAIAIWTVPLFLEKKRLRAILLIVLAMLIHPYVVIYLVAAFFTKGVWDRRTVLLLILTAVGASLYGTLITRILSLTSMIGDDYDISWFTEASGMNVYRFLTYLVVPLLSFLCRDELRRRNDRFVFVSVNLCTVAACAFVFSQFGDSNMFGRMANYLDVFQCLSIAYLLKYALKNRTVAVIIKILSVFAYCFFYYSYYIKYVTAWVDGDWSACVYEHITLYDLFAGW